MRFDAKRKVLYVSNIDGEPWAADGKGSIAKVGSRRQGHRAEWVTGLDCPKGLALSADGKWLYAADCRRHRGHRHQKPARSRKKIAIPEGV